MEARLSVADPLCTMFTRVLCSACTGAPLSGSPNSMQISTSAYDVFAGVRLTDAYNWTDCPDDIPDGPVALLHTPKVLPGNAIVLPHPSVVLRGEESA